MWISNGIVTVGAHITRGPLITVTRKNRLNDAQIESKKKIVQELDLVKSVQRFKAARK